MLIKDTRIKINTKNNDGCTGFHLACLWGHLTVIEMLIKDTRLEINTKNNDGNTAFHLVCYYGHFAIIELLIKDICLDLNINKLLFISLVRRDILQLLKC